MNNTDFGSVYVKRMSTKCFPHRDMNKFLTEQFVQTVSILFGEDNLRHRFKVDVHG